MKSLLVCLAFAALLGVGSAVEYANCYFYATANEPNLGVSWATFQGAVGSVNLTVSLTGLSVNLTGAPGNTPHPVHVHDNGDITDTTGTRAGGHYNPQTKPHGCPETNGTLRHNGDNGNFNVASTGVVLQSKTLDLLALSGTESIIGRAAIYHQQTDDCGPVANGNAGSRGAYCVIGIGNMAGNTAASGYVPATWPVYAVASVRNTSLWTGAAPFSGSVYFKQDTPTSATLVLAKFDGLTGTRGFHIHQFGDLSANPTSQGSHFNPLAQPHGIPPTAARHVGDMGNIWYYNAGVALYNYTNTFINLTGINNVLGRAVLVHGNSDICSQNSSLYGARIAHGVIGLTTEAFWNATAGTWANIPGTQDDSACHPATTGTTGVVSTTGAAVSTTGVAGSSTAAPSTTVTTTPSTTGAHISASAYLQVCVVLVASLLAVLAL